MNEIIIAINEWLAYAPGKTDYPEFQESRNLIYAREDIKNIIEYRRYIERMTRIRKD